MIDSKNVILPSRGPLSGVTIQRAEDRLLPVDRSIRSSVELEIAVSTRLEELARIDQRLNDERRRVAMSQPDDPARSSQGERPVRLLLVGPRLARERACIESLRLRGYSVDVAATEQEGLNIFDRCSPELVMADTHMGRHEGTDFVLALRQIAGIEEIPVILVDDARRELSRDAARRVGAAGYLVYPIDVQRISKRLSDMIHEPRRRRYTRFQRRLPARVEGAIHPCMVTTVGRGGMFIATEDALTTHSLRNCRFSLPEVAATVSCEAEVVYRRGNLGRERGGVGLRFHAFNGADENVLIDYLRVIATPEPSARV
jgi:DNA-binding response OmpR family regulator